MSTCVTGKAKLSKLTAMIRLAEAQRKGRSERRVFACVFCGAWHLTSQAKDNPHASLVDRTRRLTEREHEMGRAVERQTRTEDEPWRE